MSMAGQSPLPVLVRPATPADMDQVQAIYAYYVTRSAASFEEEVPSVAEMRRRRDDVVDRNLPYLVAEDDGEVLGYTYAGPWRPRSAYRYTVEDSIYVAPFVQGRGIGKALLGALIDRCTELGYRRMIAVIGDSANQGSIGLHRSLGFRQEGVLRGVGLKFGRWVDVVIMHRVLGDDDRPLPDGGSAPPLPRHDDF
ncbi:GNAT family N-acetyltransferase [Magnetospirillum gryphiswaldense]|jgi:L-amino acid N-acyltransferase YncA|uniref:GCN5-related N-acetyltransferase n=1 Tax=Magnetospirillum gryphiswaldense TaxID=55518 RepID=A4TUM8_9PROT|nr:GNAT family N-acetyltransferase [Magnetospirillum gryphiswaldense]AVM73241.1 Phosphinothricin N-acetyltransferase [Magnetospirillum gryphiswaldense MSR-1]AVM77144.1 Phosphinothricin N-acetyltransferase [Magnetospirillum gryphiswaldense]CAM74335.1 GCN5-related N-acetyltransferase [Magnetospirillum gryphiswaldense MSR-1]